MNDDGATQFCTHTTDGTICNRCMGRNTTGESRAEKGSGGIMADEPGDGEWGEMTDELDDRIDEAIEQRAHHVVGVNTKGPEPWERHAPSVEADCQHSGEPTYYAEMQPGVNGDWIEYAPVEAWAKEVKKH